MAEQTTKTNEGTEFKHLVRVASTDLEGNKNLLFALTKIKGVDISFANAVLSVTDIPKDKKTGILDSSDVDKLNEVFENPSAKGIPEWMCNRRKDYETGEDKHILSGTLDFTKDNDIKRLKKIKSNRGMRHAWNLPLRGQRTKANFRKNKKKITDKRKR
ncbi:MAG: 30S ribosomal protein S13 [Candidatus Woesearchaeota archaeon]